MANTWNEKRAADHIDKKIASVEKVEVLEYTRERKLETIPISKSYRVHGVHLYVDILNLADMLDVTWESWLDAARLWLSDWLPGTAA